MDNNLFNMNIPDAGMLAPENRQFQVSQDAINSTLVPVPDSTVTDSSITDVNPYYVKPTSPWLGGAANIQFNNPQSTRAALGQALASFGRGLATSAVQNAQQESAQESAYNLLKAKNAQALQLQAAKDAAAQLKAQQLAKETTFRSLVAKGYKPSEAAAAVGLEGDYSGIGAPTTNESKFGTYDTKVVPGGIVKTNKITGESWFIANDIPGGTSQVDLKNQQIQAQIEAAKAQKAASEASTQKTTTDIAVKENAAIQNYTSVNTSADEAMRDAQELKALLSKNKTYTGTGGNIKLTVGATAGLNPDAVRIKQLQEKLTGAGFVAGIKNAGTAAGLAAGAEQKAQNAVVNINPNASYEDQIKAIDTVTNFFNEARNNVKKQTKNIITDPNKLQELGIDGEQPVQKWRRNPQTGMPERIQ